MVGNDAEGAWGENVATRGGCSMVGDDGGGSPRFSGVRRSGDGRGSGDQGTRDSYFQRDGRSSVKGSLLGVTLFAQGDSNVIRSSAKNELRVAISSAIDGRNGDWLGWGAAVVSSDSS